MRSRVFTGSNAFGGRQVTQPSHSHSAHGLLEGGPHDVIHDPYVNGHMGDPDTAALDPLFYLHHSNVDRIWLEWLRLGNGRTNPNSSGPWGNQTFTFYDENSTTDQDKVTIAVSDVEEITALGYSYDIYPDEEGPAHPVEYLEKIVMAVSEAKTRPLNERVQVHLQTTQQAEKFITKLKASDAAPVVIAVSIHRVRFKGGRDSAIHVYLNVPQGVKQLTPESVYYGGTFSFFGRDGHDGPLDSEVAVTTTVLELLDRKVWGEDVTITLVREPTDVKAGLVGEVTFDKLTLYAAPN